MPSAWRKIFIGFALVILLLILGGGVFLYFKSNRLQVVKQLSQPAQTVTLEKDRLLQFAEFEEEQVTITPIIPQYALKIDELENIGAIEKSLQKSFSEEERNALVNQGFFTSPAPNKLSKGDEEIEFRHGGVVDEFVSHYKDIAGELSADSRLPENTVFVTSDFLLHVFHVFLDRTFQYIEESQFHPKLGTLSGLLFEKSLIEHEKANDKEIKDSFTRLATFFLVPKVLLETSLTVNKDNYVSSTKEEEKTSQNDETVDKPENILAKLDTYKDKIPEGVYQKAKEELQLINKASDLTLSPLFGEFRSGQREDYTQYKPRSHYTKNSLLRSYWKAMIWYGRNGFLVKSDQLTLDGIIQTILLTTTEKDNQKALSLWENIYRPTVFFVGKSDDLTVYDYQKIVKQVYGENINFAVLTNKDKLTQFKDEVKKLASPLIQSSVVMVGPDTTKEEALEETKSFRFMGQRFIPDSFIFSTLTQGDEAPDKETGQKLPSIPTALMPMSIFKSVRAQVYLEKWIAKNASDSDRVIAKEKKKLEETFSKLTIADWTQNLYWSWLYTLRSLFQTFQQGYPQFMQSTLWNDKDLNTALGSYTELRHDTLLYAKQSYAELGGGGLRPTPPPVPKGYVEPNLVFLNRMIALAKMTKEGLENNGVMPEEQKWKADNLIETFTFFKTIAEKELKNEVISDEDFEKLRIAPVMLNEILTPPQSTLSFMKTSEVRAGLIADVHTAVTQSVQEILYEATGIPNIIYVAVKDTNGVRLTRGVTYSYFEFTRPFGERLSDSDWQAVIYEGKQSFPMPEVPEWAKSLEK